MFSRNIQKIVPLTRTSFTPTLLKVTSLRNFSCSSIWNRAVQQNDLAPLKLANELYAVFKVHERPYLVTEGDIVTLPFRMKEADVGDTLILNDVTTLGSRNFKLIDKPIDPKFYSLKAVVVEKTKRAFQVREVTKRRNRKVRHATSKADLTVIRISELAIK
ncbi:hypothetical protein TPHA_0I00910 [Tetrapisispora phaffii CBS 4417]|uniref:Large ribosomal subunit protein bL21m n=1 Tax=Tetrapisispora phaffii (strain ATCC 24235 / CBS 4417 / NBRC 1672 / NRRL Y-8282 / UCD 70-5) TaxID=1071381 RepID=G8BXG9_TETPH|nr:mitochondrial 54S ribosomal protein YmL49 TPHA_0I00910 [Tetrapisispora phaffii CBS 4417]CCE64597.1 hypothetical protein TPHA_0I00910 [Tetrapisispora phaffii CBS 4417]